MEDVRQIIIQDNIEVEKRIVVQTGNDIFKLSTTAVSYDSLTQEQKDVYDAFVNMVKQM